MHAELRRRLGGLRGLEDVRAELRRRLGARPSSLQALEAHGHVVAYSALSPVSHALVCAVLQERGGQPIDPRNGQPSDAPVPKWAHEPLDARSASELAELDARWLETIGVEADEDRALWDELRR